MIWMSPICLHLSSPNYIPTPNHHALCLLLGDIVWQSSICMY
ncbi:unnamed protein product, partial [Larinioides sclopetarius]